MERMAWTDERLDDLSGEVRELRREMRAEFSEARGEMHAGFSEVRGEMRAGFAELSGQIDALRLMFMRIGGAMLIALLGIIAAILTRGV